MICPAGYYCPAGTGPVWSQCPSGTYSALTGLYQESQCTACTGGKYCDTAALTAVSGDCDAGYYCTEGSDTATPDTGYKGTAGACTRGSYCPQGSVTPEPCPAGTFSNTSHLTAKSECTTCSYGHYCDSAGLVEPTGPCDAGFYCLNGATSPNNIDPVSDPTSGPCPAGHYCVQGTSYPVECPCGSYQPTSGMATCEVRALHNEPKVGKNLTFNKEILV